MAIKYYCGLDMLASIDLNQNQLVKPRIENLGSDPSGVEGQIYYNTANDVLRLYTAAGWVTLASAGGVTAFSNAFGTFVSGTANSSATGAVNMGTIDLSASGSPDNTKFLRGDNVWAVPADTGITSITLGSDGDATSGNTITANGTLTLSFDGSSSQYVNGAGDLVTFPTIPQGDITAVTTTSPITGGGTSGSVNIAHAAQTQTNTTPSSSLSFGGTFTALSANVGVNGTGHVTGQTLTTFTLPSNPNVDTKYTLPTTNGNNPDIVLTGTDSSTDIVNMNGTSTTVSVTGSGTNTLTFDLVDSPTIANSLTVTNDLSVGDDIALTGGSSKITGLVTAQITNDTDAANKKYVDDLVAGGLTFKDGFDAGTGAIDGGGNLTTGASRVAVSVGDYYVVTSAGSFYGSVALDIGDSVIAKLDAAQGTSDVNDWVIVQGDEGVVSLALTTGTSTGAPLTANATSGAITLTSRAYAGASNAGYVPTGGSATTFLRGDGTWVTPTNTPPRSAGIGLSLNGNTIDANVDGTNSVAANASSSTSGRTYKVQVDSADKLCVNVPWTDSVGAVTSVDKSSTNNRKGIFVDPTTGAVKVGLDIIGQTNLTSLAAADDFLVYDQSTTTNKRVGFDTLKSAIAGTATITLSGDVTGSGTTSISTTIATSAVEAGMLNNNVISGQTELAAAPATSDELLISDAGTIKRISVANLASAVQGNNGYAVTLTSPSAGSATVTHSLGSYDVIVQLFGDTSKETIYACVDRTSTNALSITFDSAVGEDVRVLVSKVS